MTQTTHGAGPMPTTNKNDVNDSIANHVVFFFYVTVKTA